MKKLFLLLLTCFSLVASAQTDVLWHVHLSNGVYTITDSVSTPHRTAALRYSDTINDPLIRQVEIFDTLGHGSVQTTTLTEADFIIKRPKDRVIKVLHFDKNGKLNRIDHIKPRR